MLLVSNVGPLSSNISIDNSIHQQFHRNQSAECCHTEERSRSMSSENKVQYDIDSLKNLHKRSQGGPKNRAEAH